MSLSWFFVSLLVAEKSGLGVSSFPTKDFLVVLTFRKMLITVFLRLAALDRRWVFRFDSSAEICL